MPNPGEPLDKIRERMENRDVAVENSVQVVCGNPYFSFNPTFENHMIADRVITSSGYYSMTYNGFEYRTYVYKNAAGSVVTVSSVGIELV